MGSEGESCLRKGDNVYQRKDGRWEARYIKGRDPSGKVIRGYCYGESREEALQKAKAAQNPQGRLVSELLNEWLEERSAHVKASSLENYRTVVNKYIMPRLGGRYSDELDKKMLGQFKRELMEKDKLSASRAQTVLLVLQATLRYGNQDRPDSPLSKELIEVPYPDRPEPEVRVLTEAERLRLITHLQLGMDDCKFGILLALSTGLRVGELCSLRWKDISIPDRELHVTATMQRVKQPDGRTKIIVSRPSSASSVRTIPLTERVAALCERMCPGDPEAYILTGTWHYMEPRAAQYKLKQCTDKCELEGVSFRTLRDTFTRQCAEAGLDAETLCEILGYASIRSIPNSLLHTPTVRKRTGKMLLEEAGL